MKRLWTVLLGLSMISFVVACSVTPTHRTLPADDYSSACPDGSIHLQIEPSIWKHSGEMAEGRQYTLVVAARATDPNYAGVTYAHKGPVGHNPIVVQGYTPEGAESVVDPVLCIPADKAVAILVRVAMQHPAEAYEKVECNLDNRGIVVGGRVSSPGGLTANLVASDNVMVYLEDMVDKNHWYIAQCDWLYTPAGGAPGPVPNLFPRPGATP